MKNIKVIIKRAFEPFGRLQEIPNDMETFQKYVGGYVEIVRISDRVAILCNEDGKLIGLHDNFFCGYPIFDTIKGVVVVVGIEGEEFADVPLDLAEWTHLLAQWAQ